MSLQRLLAVFLFVLLSTQATWFAVAAVLISLWQVIHTKKIYLWGTFLCFIMLGVIGQLFSSNTRPDFPEKPPFLSSASPSSQTKNLITIPLLYDVAGWNFLDGSYRSAQKGDQGFWRIPRNNPTTGRVQTEVLGERWVSLEVGQTYTQSFYIRHDGNTAKFIITFFTQRGHNPVNTHIQPVAPRVWRVWGSYTAQAGDVSVRVIDFFPPEGDFTYLDVGWAQLEQHPEPTPFHFGKVELRNRSERIVWWAGAGLLGLLTLQTGIWLFSRLNGESAAIALLAGLALHLLYILWQLWGMGEARATGLTPQPNILGHGMVVIAGLTWAVGGNRLGGLAILLAGFGVWASGSRAALWGLLLLLLVWCWGLGRLRWPALGLLAFMGILLLMEPGILGRLSQAFTVDTNAQARLQFWEVAWMLAREHPLNGIGFGNFNQYFQLNMPSGAIEFAPGHSHNLFLHLLTEGGLFALSGVIILLTGVARLAWKAQNRAVLTLLGSVLVLNIVDFTFFVAWSYYPLMMAVAWILIRKQELPSVTMPR